MERKKVAVFLANIYKDMTKETQNGIIEAAKSKGIKLIFFTSFNDNYSSKKYIRYKNYDKGDMSVFMLPKLSEYDGLISLDSYDYFFLLHLLIYQILHLLIFQQ